MACRARAAAITSGPPAVRLPPSCLDDRTPRPRTTCSRSWRCGASRYEGKPYMVVVQEINNRRKEVALHVTRHDCSRTCTQASRLIRVAPAAAPTDHVQLLVCATKEQAGALVHGSTHDAGVGLLECAVHGRRADHVQHVPRKVHGGLQLRRHKLCLHLPVCGGSCEQRCPSSTASLQITFFFSGIHDAVPASASQRQPA